MAQSLGVNSTLKRAYEWAQSYITSDVAVVDVEGRTLEFELVPGTPTAHVHENFENEDTVFNEISDSIKSDDVFYDIGAYIGVYATFVGMNLDEGEVHAFEALPERFEILNRNFK